MYTGYKIIPLLETSPGGWNGKNFITSSVKHVPFLSLRRRSEQAGRRHSPRINNSEEWMTSRDRVGNSPDGNIFITVSGAARSTYGTSIRHRSAAAGSAQNERSRLLFVYERAAASILRNAHAPTRPPARRAGITAFVWCGDLIVFPDLPIQPSSSSSAVSY